jgi:hypothetical protein
VSNVSATVGHVRRCGQWTEVARDGSLLCALLHLPNPIFNRGSESHRSSGTSEGRGDQSLK